MLLNISTDQIIYLSQGETYILPYTDIERTLGPRLLNLFKQHTPSTLYVINGPGSFTTLRVACLTINLIKQKYDFTIFTCTKPALFHWLHTTTDFPQLVGLTIGQKKNCRLYDTKTQQEEKISFGAWQEKQDILIDPVIDNEIIGGETYAHRQLHLQRSNQDILLTNTTKNRLLDLGASCRKEVDILHPDYLIDPTMG